MGGNKDRYGYRRRSDDAHDVGDPQPADVGDSDGTFHDRARRNNDVIVGGKVRSEDVHERSSAEVSDTNADGETSWENKGGTSQQEAVGSVVEIEIERGGGTRDTIGRWKNHQVHIDGGTPGETVRVRLDSGNGFLIGERVGVRE